MRVFILYIVFLVSLFFSIPSLADPPLGIIDINHASLEELLGLPGIGPVKAKAILEYRKKRPFRRKQDLLNIKGIGPKRMRALKDLILVDPHKPSKI